MEEADREGPAPLRVLGAFDASMLVVGNVIGGGIFLVGGSVAKLTHSAGVFLALWLVGGAFALSGALCNGELGAMFPRGGGEYIYLSRAYGPGLGFLSGWTSFWIVFPGSVATLAAGLGREVAGLTGVSTAVQKVIGLAVVVALTLLNTFGLRPGKWVQNILSVAKLSAFVAALVAGAFYIPHAGAGFVPIPGEEHASALALALIPIYFAYSGWNAATYVAGEMRNPHRDLGRALVIGTVACIVLYVAVNAAFVGTLGLDAMRRTADIAGTVSSRLFGRGAGAFVTAIVIVAVLSSLQATIVVGPRIYHAMAEDGLFLRRLASLHPTTRVPIEGLVSQGLISCALLLTGGFDRLLTFTTFALVLFSIVAVAAVPVLRWKQPGLARPFRTPAYPLTPAIYIAGNLWVLYSVVASGAKEAIVGLGIVLSGVPFYLYFRRSTGTRPG